MNAVKLAVQSQYSDFSDTVKSIMRQKMADHWITQKYTKEFDHYQNLKKKFEKISLSDRI